MTFFKTNTRGFSESQIFQVQDTMWSPQLLSIHCAPTRHTPPPSHNHQHQHIKNKMSPVSKTRSARAKTRTVTKRTKRTSEEPVEEGMLFIFTFPGMDGEAYISSDPMFDNICGYQRDFTKIFTEEMIEKMASVIKEEYAEDMHVTERCTPEELASFLYQYGLTLAECDDGQVAKGTVLVHVS